MPEDDGYLAPEAWAAQAPEKKGSWWPAWHAWLVGHSGDQVKPPGMGKARAGFDPLCDAPGTYVLQG